MFVRIRNQSGMGGEDPNLLSITFCKEVCDMYNHFLLPNNLRRFVDVQTSVYVCHPAIVNRVLESWSLSRDPKDTLYNLPLPGPNLKDFSWRDVSINNIIASSGYSRDNIVFKCVCIWFTS